MALDSRPLNSWDIAKVIAILLMFVDHSGEFVYLHDNYLRAIGRGAAPIFLFLAGFAASYHFNRELLVLAILMTISNLLLGCYTHAPNILFTILACRAVFAWLEKRGKKIERPFEWMMPSVVFIPISIFTMQYGTLGLLFAMCGYMRRRSHIYSKIQRTVFMILTFLIYGASQALLFKFTQLEVLAMIPVLGAVYMMLAHMEIRDIDSNIWPQWSMRLMKFVSYYSAYIYVIHVVLLSQISGVPF